MGNDAGVAKAANTNVVNILQQIILMIIIFPNSV